jgi:3-hydroxyacyl-[acyl-carrier-protein] dehydratase
MTGLEMESRTLTSRFSFPPEFIGFQGHFPSKKILPGVCQIQCALSTLEKGRGKGVVLKEVVLAKYFSPLLPDDEMTCVVTDGGETGGEHTIKAVIMKNMIKIAELKLRVLFAGHGRDR